MLWNYEPETSKYGNKMIPPLKQLIIFLVGWLGFQLFAATVQITIISFAAIRGIDGSAYLETNSGAMVVNSVCYLALLIAIVLITNVDITKLFKSFKQYQSYIAAAVCLVTILTFNNLYLRFLSILPLPEATDNANETSIQSITAVFPITSIIIFGVVGPICEEFTYRVGLFSFFKRKSKWLAYLITIVIFAFIHFNFSFDSAKLLNEFLNLPLYMFAAFAFSFTYGKFGLAGSLTAHIANNLLSLTLSDVAIIH